MHRYTPSSTYFLQHIQAIQIDMSASGSSLDVPKPDPSDSSGVFRPGTPKPPPSGGNDNEGPVTVEVPTEVKSSN